MDFPWSPLDWTRPTAYVSMGTLQNGVHEAFRRIVEARAGTALQLVISSDGGQGPAQLGDLPGDPIMVGYAPPLDRIELAARTFSNGA